MTEACTISHSLDVLAGTIEAIQDLQDQGQDSEVAAVTLAGITLLLAITDDYGPEYFTDDEQAYIIEADQYLSETIKEFYPNE
tara:strand:- start:1204 stop:1452 length:249 start_codon:yes stop_codon:yes gene_type:complete